MPKTSMRGVERAVMVALLRSRLSGATANYTDAVMSLARRQLAALYGDDILNVPCASTRHR